jgi:hypothetical protein
MTDLIPCARGCKQARRHTAACLTSTQCPDHSIDCRGCQPRPPNRCRGCQPREAKHGLLCKGCHSRLLEWLKEAPWQEWLLLEVAQVPTLAQSLKTDADAIHAGVDEAPTPLNIVAATAATLISDVLSGWVEMLAEQHEMAGPFRLTTQAQRFDPGQPWARWSVFAADWLWVEPPVTFQVRSACTWLLAQIDLLESCPGIGDLWGELGEAMAQAHALVPWRKQEARLKGIECPECHRIGLSLFGGDEHVTCGECNAHISPGRYAIWTRILAERERVGA